MLTQLAGDVLCIYRVTLIVKEKWLCDFETDLFTETRVYL